MTEFRRTERKAGPTEMISLRLPVESLRAIDEIAALEHSSRTDILRRSFALYGVARKGLVLPLSAKMRDKLLCISNHKKVPVETTALQILERGVDKEYEECGVTKTWSFMVPTVPKYTVGVQADPPTIRMGS